MVFYIWIYGGILYLDLWWQHLSIFVLDKVHEFPIERTNVGGVFLEVFLLRQVVDLLVSSVAWSLGFREHFLTVSSKIHSISCAKI